MRMCIPVTMIACIATTAAASLLLGGCASSPPQTQHPLTNTVVRAESGALVSRAALLSAMSEADVVYLGETHDNPTHHQNQHRVLDELIRLGKQPAVGFEIFSTDKSSALMEYIGTHKGDNSSERADTRLRAIMGIQDALDERWSNYGPLLQLARVHDLTVFGIDLPDALRRRVSRVGIDGLSPVERSALPEIGIADPAYRQLMMARLKAAHCGYGEEAYLQRLFENWQARNETMARAIVAAASARGRSPVVVILGGGHVRDGQGVVPRVAEHMPGARQLIVSFVEVEEAREDAAQYLPSARTSGAQPRHHQELLWFTTAQGLSMDDACKAFQHAKTKSP